MPNNQAQNLLRFEKALKEHYLPVWRNQLSTEPAAILGKIKKVPLKSDKIVASAPIGLSGGFGFSAEGEATPLAGNVRFERFETLAKDMYTNIEISAKATKLTGTAGAMASALDTEVKGAYEAAKWNVGRSIHGNGTGVLTTIKGTTGNLIEVTSTKFLKEGLIIDIYEGDPGVDAEPAIKGRRILAVDRTSDTPKILIDGASATIPTGFITVQQSYKREITGLGAIFDENVTSLYGVSKADNPFIKPIAVDAGDSLEDGIITHALRRAKNEKNTNIDTLLCGDIAFDDYIDFLRTNNIRVEEVSKTITGGFKAIKFLFGNNEVDIVNESFIPDDEMWGFSAADLELHAQEWEFATLQGGGIFNLRENSSVYRALLCNYGDLICKNPGGCVRIYNCGFTRA